MPGDADPYQLAEAGKLAFQEGRYEPAAQTFGAAAQAFSANRDELNAAEMRNNQSVALLQGGKAREALEAAAGTDEIFANAGDRKRQGMAVGNQAAALEGLKRFDEALEAYERSAELFAEAGEGDLRAMVLKSGAAIKLRRGKVTESALKMIGSLEAKQKPSLFERLLKFLLRFKP